MAFKLFAMAEHSWRRLNAPQLVGLVPVGAVLHHGIGLEGVAGHGALPDAGTGLYREVERFLLNWGSPDGKLNRT